MDTRLLSVLGTITLLAAVHVAYGALLSRFERQSKWLLQFSAGVALAYVFIYLLPKIGDATGYIAAQGDRVHDFGVYRLYLFLLAGFLSYYAVDFLEFRGTRASAARLTLHTAGFCIYNALVGFSVYHLPRNHDGAFLLAALVLALHFFGINHLLHDWHGRQFERIIRWLLVASLLTGAALGGVLEYRNDLAIMAIAFIGGAIMMNAIRIKLPEPQDARLMPLLLGATLVVVISFILRSLDRL
jgi:hypothetical protein